MKGVFSECFLVFWNFYLKDEGGNVGGLVVVLGRRFPLFPEEILTKQGNVFIGLPRLVSAVSD